MSHYSDSQQRRSKKYQLLHEQLKREVKPFHKSYTVSPAPSEKTERKRARSADYKLHGDA